MVDSTVRWPKIIAAKIVAEALAIALIALALIAAFAIGARPANAAEHSGEPSEIAERHVAAMALPNLATQRMSTLVTGVLAAPEAGPLAGYELHFQGRVSGNMYSVRTKADGAFSTMLPQGVYDLRDIHGTVIARAVTVGQSPVNLGQVHPPGPYSLWRLLEKQKLGPSIVKSPAPATAYVPSPGEGLQAVAVTPVTSPKVMGAGAKGEALAPAEVIPAQIKEQTELPSGAEVPSPGMPAAQDIAPGPGGY